MQEKTRRIVAMHVGGPGVDDAGALWRNLPAEHRRRARFVTDSWEAYDTVIPPARHFRVGKGKPGTQKIGQFNNTLRQSCSRLVRKTLSF